nr:GntR family transcriptional regulator [Sphingobium sp. SYK-6]
MIWSSPKRQLRNGVLAPGAPVEPAVIGNELGASITAVRDALLRLTGEQLVQFDGAHYARRAKGISKITPSPK